MKWTSYIRSFAFPRLLKPGAIIAPISLTAEDGTWVQSTDYIQTHKVLWVSVKNATDENTARWVRSFSREIDQIHEHDCRMFVVSSDSLDDIREFHRKVDLSCHALYDPMAMESRKLGLSGRRPMCRDAVLLVDEFGKVMDSLCGQSSIEHWLGLLGAQTEAPVIEDDSVSPIIPLSAEETEILMEQGGILVDVRTFSEYEPDHVPKSLHIPVDELPQRYEEIGQSTRIIFICQAGGRAYSAAEFMTSIGSSDIFVVNGGMSSWTGLRNTDGVVS